MATKALMATAYHEAGHAVAAWELGVGIREVTIVPDEDEGSLGHLAGFAVGGWFTPDLKVTARIERRLKNGIIVTLAGPEAERRFRGRFDRVGANRDWQNALEEATYVSGGDVDIASLYVKWLSATARAMIQDDLTTWPLIETLAAALIERPRMSGRAVRACLLSAQF